MNIAKSLFNQEGTGSQALNAKMEGGQLAGDKTGRSSLEAPGARAMDGPGCCFLSLAHLPKIALRVSPCTLWGHGLQRSLVPGRSAPMAENLNRGDPGSRSQRERRRKQRGRYGGLGWWPERVGHHAEQEWGQRDTSREGQNKESWGESSEAKLIILGGEEGTP